MFGIDYVRVKDRTNGYELTVVRSVAEADPDAYEILKDAPAVDHNDAPLPPVYGDQVVDYEKQGVKELKAEIAKRNKDRDQPIPVDEPGNKPQLVAALVLDDAAHADTSGSDPGGQGSGDGGDAQ